MPMDLKELYLVQLNKLHSAEKKFLPLYDRLKKAANTDELKKVFAPSETSVESHLERFAMLLKTHSVKPSTVIGDDVQFVLEQSAFVLKLKVRNPLEKEVSVIEFSALLYQVKISHYDQLLQMAKALGLEIDTSLLEQSIAENKNNYGYLMQLAGNIVYKRMK
jgi:ferritin-like metal-binding protein YciE